MPVNSFAKKFDKGGECFRVWFFLATSPALDVGSTIQGLSLRGEAATAIYGGALDFNLGLTSVGMRAWLDDRLVLQWQGEAALVAGAVAYEHPFYGLYGARAEGAAVALWRFSRTRSLSAVVDVGNTINAVAIAPSGIAKVNNLDGLGGVFANSAWRAGGGISWWRGRHSLIVTADGELEADSPESTLSGRVFFGGALHARYDLLSSLMIVGEAYLGVSLPNDEPALDLSQQTNRWLLSLTATKKFGSRKWHHFFLDAGIIVARDQTLSAYGKQTLTTLSPVNARLSLGGGYSF